MLAIVGEPYNQAIFSRLHPAIPASLAAFEAACAKVQAASLMPQSGYAGWAVPRASHRPALAEAFITQMLSEATARALLSHGPLSARQLRSSDIGSTGGFQRSYLQALASATPGVYLDGAPVPNLNATMEANVQLVLQHVETPGLLLHSLQLVYTSHGVKASSIRTDGEF